MEGLVHDKAIVEYSACALCVINLWVHCPVCAAAVFSSQYEMYIIERNAERTASAGRLLYDM